MTQSFALLDKENVVIGIVHYHGSGNHVPAHTPHVKVNQDIKIGMVYEDGYFYDQNQEDNDAKRKWWGRK